ncbi:hypothetical protein OKB92_23750 [Methylorubrum extorquens]|nr:hypothetical protein [Methylorubrum extorquens]UYW31947.1 hypothetical protein OKB92_23750 [Methylorubrum extorquens]
MLARDRRLAELELNDPGDLLAAREVVPEVDDGAGRPDEAVDPVLVPAVLLVVLDTTVGLRLEPELSLEQGPPPGPGAGVVLDAVLRVDVEMVDRLIGPAPEAHRHELADLTADVPGPEPARRDDDDLVVLRLHQVPG